MTSRRIPVRLAREVRRRAAQTCEHCRLPQSSQEAAFHIDHIQPRSSGGETVAENLALACVTCSLCKAARELVPYPRTGELVPIFHPRKHRWTDHFAWTPTWRLRGKTAIGRATIAALRMNRRAIVAIRQQLVALGEFPP